jgi:hypothetical protein
MGYTNELKGNFRCVWSETGSTTHLDLHDKTLKEAMEIAKHMGFTPRTWYRPSTWSNHYTFRASSRTSGRPSPWRWQR